MSERFIRLFLIMILIVVLFLPSEDESISGPIYKTLLLYPLGIGFGLLEIAPTFGFTELFIIGFRFLTVIFPNICIPILIIYNSFFLKSEKKTFWSYRIILLLSLLSILYRVYDRVKMNFLPLSVETWALFVAISITFFVELINILMVKEKREK